MRGGRGRGGRGRCRGSLDPTDSTLLFLSEVRVRVACGSLLRQGNVRRLRWDAEPCIGPFRLEILRNRDERRQRRQFRLPISKRKCLAVSETACACFHNSRGACTGCDQRKDVNGALVAPDAYFRLVRAKSDAVDLRLIRSASQLACLLPGSGIPHADQRPSDGRRREQPPRRRHGEGRDGCVVRHDDRM